MEKLGIEPLIETTGPYHIVKAEAHLFQLLLIKGWLCSADL